MAEAVSLRPEKSTTGRFSMKAARLFFGALSGVAPDRAASLALDLFMRPQRRPPRTPRVDGLETHHFHHGGMRVWDWGDGPTVLLAHGWAGSASQLSSFVAPLVRAGYYVAAPDFPAHGYSAGRTANVRIFADALAELGHRLGPVHAVVGHSLGGTAAVLAAALGTNMRALVLMGSPARVHPFARHFAAALGLSAAASEEMLARIEAVIGGRSLADLRLSAPQQQARLLDLHDAADPEVPALEGRSLAAAWPAGRFEELSGLGHRGMLRDADVVRRVVAFVDAQRPRAQELPRARAL
jgi:pimeloyl-ACP methyl ester carboxylesterase